MEVAIEITVEAILLVFLHRKYSNGYLYSANHYFVARRFVLSP